MLTPAHGFRRLLSLPLLSLLCMFVLPCSALKSSFSPGFSLWLLFLHGSMQSICFFYQNQTMNPRCLTAETCELWLLWLIFTSPSVDLQWLRVCSILISSKISVSCPQICASANVSYLIEGRVGTVLCFKLFRFFSDTKENHIPQPSKIPEGLCGPRVRAFLRVRDTSSLQSGLWCSL